MRVVFDLLIRCVDERTAQSLELVLYPDNRIFPKDQRFNFIRDGKTLRFNIESPRIMPALSSLESLLSDAKLFQEVWSLSK
jgi:hypothetical protein